LMIEYCIPQSASVGEQPGWFWNLTRPVLAGSMRKIVSPPFEL